MNFRGSGCPLSDEGFEHPLLLLDVEPAALWAVLHVETSGFGFLPSRRPVILFERHIFHRLTQGRFDVEQPDISNPVPGGYLGGAAEYARLNAASTLDPDAALMSTSWGIGQVLGEHFHDLGFKSVEQMAESMVMDEDSQLLAAAWFMSDLALDKALQQHDWKRFASVYNGAGYARDGYDLKLSAAYARFQKTLPDLDVRAAQAALFFLGYKPGPIDGILGPLTRRAVVEFQRKKRMAVTGSLDWWMTEILYDVAFAA